MIKNQLDPKSIDDISRAVAKKLNQDKIQKVKQQRDWRLRNTKLLLKNYHILKEHCAKINSELDDYIDAVFDPADIEIQSVMKSKAKTRRMVWYIDEMLMAYERYSLRAGEAAKRRYLALVSYHIHDTRLSFEELSRRLNVSERTARRDLDDARLEFSVFLFGLNALEDLESTD